MNNRPVGDRSSETWSYSININMVMMMMKMMTVYCTSQKKYRLCVKIKVAVFWDIETCNHVEIARRFKNAYCHHHQGDNSRHSIAEYSRLNFLPP
jgi:hypothetical protein